MSKDLEKLRDISKDFAEDSIVFYTGFLKYINSKVSYITPRLDRNHNAEHDKIIIQKVYLQALQHQTTLLKRNSYMKKPSAIKRRAVLFNQDICDKAKILVSGEEKIDFYKLKTAINIPRFFMVDIIDVLNLVNNPDKTNSLDDKEVWIIKKGEEYFLDGKKMKLQKNSMYLPLFKVIYSFLGKEGGSMSFDFLIKHSRQVIPEMNTAPKRNKEKIYKTIRNTLFTNNNGIRRVSHKMEEILFNLPKSHIITFDNLK